MSKKNKPTTWAEFCEKLPVEIADTHTHAHMITSEYLEKFNERNRRKGFEEIQPPSLEKVISDAKQVGVTRIVECACDLDYVKKVSDDIKDYDNIRGAIAIHPNEATLHAKIQEVAPDGLEPPKLEERHELSISEVCEIVYEIAKNNPQITIIGETGIDLFRTGKGGLQAQIDSFRKHIEIAKELDLTLQIHDRDAHKEFFDVLKKDKAPSRTIIHSFSGDLEFAKMCCECGYYMGFSGPVTFNANDHLRDAFKYIYENYPELLLLETDAPFLTPMPHRSSPNAPYMTAYVARFISEFFGIDLAELCSLVHKNEMRACFYK